MKLITLTLLNGKSVVLINPVHVVSLMTNPHDQKGSCVVALVNKTDFTVVEQIDQIRGMLETLNR